MHFTTISKGFYIELKQLDMKYRVNDSAHVMSNIGIAWINPIEFDSDKGRSNMESTLVVFLTKRHFFLFNSFSEFLLSDDQHDQRPYS